MFKLGKIKHFAAEQALIISTQIPAQTVINNPNKLSIIKTTKALENIYKSSAEFKKENNLGFIGISLFGNYFKWELKNKSYPDSFIDMATEGLIVSLFSKKQ